MGNEEIKVLTHEEAMKNRLSTAKAAKLMNVSEQFIRVGLQTKQLPFGYAVKRKSRWCYYISPAKFTEFTGIKIEGANVC